MKSSFPAALARRILRGDRAAAARAISALENRVAGAADLLKRLDGARRAWVVGVTGSPGVGKSTLLARLLARAAAGSAKAGALLIDPSSPFSGGALLGDRVRLGEVPSRSGVFVRSLASRGARGGLARSARGARRVLEALGLEIIFVETVGAGQSDVDIARFADTVLVVLMPGAGDEVQFLKAGLLEAADILVVNKSDLPGAGRTAASLRELAADRAGWIVPVLETAALDGRGVDALWRQCLRHRAHREE